MKEWQTIQLDILVKAGGGKIQTGPFGSQLHASDYVEKGIPCIMPANMKNHRVNISGIARITEEDAFRLSRHLVKEGDIVYSRRGDVTQKALISKEEEGYFCGTGCLLLRPGKHIDSAFLTYYLSTKVYQSWIVSQAVGATMPNLNTGILGRVSFCGPNITTQQKIASVLSTLDAKIELNNRINAELEGMAKLLYDYWFVQFEFPITADQAAAMGKPHLEGQPYKSSGGPMTHNPTLKRDIPEGWEVRQVADLCDLNMRSWSAANAPEFVNYLDLANVKNGVILDAQNLKGGEAPSRAKRILKQGDTIIGTVRPGNRSFSWVPKTEETLTGSTGFAVLSPKDESYREFNYLSLSSDLNIERLTTVASGAAYPAVKPEIVAALDIPMPDSQLVKKFHSAVKSSFDQIEQHNKQNQHLTSLRDWLLPMLMNGQVTVK